MAAEELLRLVLDASSKGLPDNPEPGDWNPDAVVAALLDGPDVMNLKVRVQCSAPAPMVVNGSAYIGCQLDNGHDGEHSATIKWGR